MYVAECFLLLFVENLLLHDRVEKIAMVLLPLLLYTVDMYKKYETFPCVSSSIKQNYKIWTIASSLLIVFVLNSVRYI